MANTVTVTSHVQRRKKADSKTQVRDGATTMTSDRKKRRTRAESSVSTKTGAKHSSFLVDFIPDMVVLL